MTATGAAAAPGRYQLPWGGSALELEARRDGIRTVVTLLRDGHRIAERSGVVGILLPVPEEPEAVAPAADDAAQPEAEPTQDGAAQPEPEAAPKAVVFSYLPGKINRALLVVPAPEAQAAEETSQPAPAESVDAAHTDDEENSTSAADTSGAGHAAPAADTGGAGDDKSGVDTSGAGNAASAADGKPSELGTLVAGLTGYERGEQHRFAPPPGTPAARLQAFQHTHPKLYAARHVVLAVGKVVLGLLGVALFVQLVLRSILDWITERLPDIDWPDIDLPSIPWPDIDLPDLPDITVPGWLLAIISTAKYWVPILFAIGLAAREARRRSGKNSGEHERAPSTGKPDDPAAEPEEDAPPDAHR